MKVRTYLDRSNIEVAELFYNFTGQECFTCLGSGSSNKKEIWDQHIFYNHIVSRKLINKNPLNPL